MNDRDSESARKLTRYLDLGVGEMRSGTLYRLQQARAAAMAAANASRAPQVEWATAGPGGSAAGSRFGPRNAPMRWVGIALLLAAVGFGYQQWHAVQQVREYEELDLHLLASDLPIDAYLDRGFQNWLRTSFEY